MSKTKILVLHKNRQYIDECAEILNEEWKRSKGARLHSLEHSNDKFPVNLVLVFTDNNGEKLIGHSRLSIVHLKQDSCLVESVIIRKSERGKGFGRVVMEKTEEFAISKGFKTMYLSTHDKQEFYRHLGYEFCEPIVSFGVSPNLIPQNLLKQFSALKTADQSNNCEKRTEKTKIKNEINNISVPVSAPQPAGPPPPPPPGPPPPVQVSSNMEKSDISRWDPAAISWMKKSLMPS